MPKKKKVNQLKLKECERLLQNLNQHSSSQYYTEVFKHYHRLLLFKEAHYNKPNDTQTNQETKEKAGGEGQAP